MRNEKKWIRRDRILWLKPVEIFPKISWSGALCLLPWSGRKMVLWLVVCFSHEPLTSLLRINYSLVLVHQSCAWPNILISRCGRVLPRNRKAPYVLRCLGIKVRCNNSSRESPLNIWNPSSTGESLNKSSFIWTSCIGPNAKKSMLQDQQCFALEAYILPKQSVHSTSNFKKKKKRDGKRQTASPHFT